MSVPMRKDQPELEENLTTADLAQGKSPASEDRPKEDRPKPVLAARPGETAQNITSEVRKTSETRNPSDAAPPVPQQQIGRFTKSLERRSDRLRRRAPQRRRAGRRPRRRSHETPGRSFC